MAASQVGPNYTQINLACMWTVVNLKKMWEGKGQRQTTLCSNLFPCLFIQYTYLSSCRAILIILWMPFLGLNLNFMTIWVQLN